MIVKDQLIQLNNQESIYFNIYKNSSTDLLNDTLRTANETVEIGTGIISDLYSQKEVLLRSQANAKKTQSYASEAGSILKVFYININRECIVVIFKIELLLIQ